MQIKIQLNPKKMETSIFIAKLLGLAYTVIGLGMLLNGKYYKKQFDAMMKEAGVWYLGGVMALLVGYLIVSAHNVWEGSWVVLITIIGWMALLKGLLLLLFPAWFMDWSAGLFKKSKTMSTWGIFALVLGLVFVYFGFIA